MYLILHHAARHNILWTAPDARTLLDSSTHYVGYVEDDETPEAIMKKFEALERVQKATRPVLAFEAQAPEAMQTDVGGEEQQVLTEEQLLEVFKQTSVFSVKTVQNNGASYFPLASGFARATAASHVSGHDLWSALAAMPAL
jgi:hypothetical protein